MIKISPPVEKYLRESARTKNPNIKIKATDGHLVLSTCLKRMKPFVLTLSTRQIPDSEMKDFVAKHADQLKYVATRSQHDLRLSIAASLCMKRF